MIPFYYRTLTLLCAVATSCMILAFVFAPQAGASSIGPGQSTATVSARPLAARFPLDCAANSIPDQKIDEDTINRIEQGWITAEYRADSRFLDCMLEADYRTSGKSGQVRTRQDVLDHTRLTAETSKPIPQLRTIVFIHGDNATAHSIMKTTDKSGNPKEVHFVDGYTFHDGRWFAYSGADF